MAIRGGKAHKAAKSGNAAVGWKGEAVKSENEAVKLESEAVNSQNEAVNLGWR